MPFTHRSLAGAVLVTLLGAMACDAGPTEPAPEPGLAEDAAGDMAPFHHGVFLGDDESVPGGIARALATYADLVGQRPTLVKTFFRLDADFTPAGWAGRVVREVAAAGAANLIALDLGWSDGPAENLLAEVAAGAADQRLRAVARGIATVQGVVLVEPGWEMNGDWSYPWQGAANGGDEGGPARFVEAWRRIVSIFREEGARVLWVFSPNVGNPIAGTGAGASHWNWYGHYYPGDAFVDYVGAHGFHAPALWGGPYTDFVTLFDGGNADRLLSDLAARYPHKPILVSEFAAEETPGHDKGAWVREAFRTMQSRSRIAGAVWFNMRKEADWRVDSSPGALAAYRAALDHPRVATTFRAPAIGGASLALR